jgi:hypothetical protein
LVELPLAGRAIGQKDSATYKGFKERAPIQWAATQSKLGNLQAKLGLQESGTTTLQESAAAFGEALKELTLAAARRQHDSTQRNLDQALALIAERSGK